MQKGTFEPREVALIRKQLLETDVFIDVGANVGFYTCLAKLQDKYALAIEPLMDNLRYLVANMEANGWTGGLEIFPLAVADVVGLADLYGGGTGASLVTGWAGVAKTYRRLVPCVTLDTIIGSRFTGKRLFIKMDVEGAEYTVLLGARETLHHVPKPTWLIEITLTEHRPPGHRNPRYLDTFQLMWQQGYKAFSITDTQREITENDVFMVMQASCEENRPEWASGNYLFCAS